MPISRRLRIAAAVLTCMRHHGGHVMSDDPPMSTETSVERALLAMLLQERKAEGAPSAAVRWRSCRRACSPASQQRRRTASKR